MYVVAQRPLLIKKLKRGCCISMRQPQIVAQQAQQVEIPKEYVARLPDFLSGSGKNGRFSGQGKARLGVAFPNATPPVKCISQYQKSKELNDAAYTYQ